MTLGEASRISAAVGPKASGVMLLIGLGFFVGCGSRQSNDTRQTDSGTVAVGSKACPGAEGGKRKEPILHGDIDGDHQDDVVSIATAETQRPHCRFLLVAETADGRLTQPIWQIELRSPVQTDELGLPRLELLREIDGRPGLEAVITVSESATTRYVALYSYRRGALARLRLTGVGLVAPNVFPVGGAVSSVSDVDCALNARRGEVVALTSSRLDQANDTWIITERFFEARAAGLSLTRTEHRRLASNEKQWEEDSMFRHCAERAS
jgi:hypothetical protein